ncbi:terminal protein [Duck atadenovirus A]|uniref:Terminal protein n=1 Tax=Duck atadenovirus A TaxID=130328 RepID=A0A7M4CJN2_9ADEN|nr:terminal protein [Duck atadenovirus A]
MQLTTHLNHPRLVDHRTATERGIRCANRFFNYPVTQLLDLRPNGPTTNQPPFRGEPPPNLLLGYFYMAKTLDNYLFDQRTYSNISYEYHYSPATLQRYMRWKILTDCSYSINTGAYARAIYETENFEETIHQIQNAVLMDRVVSSLAVAAQPIAGFGLPISQQNTGRDSSTNTPFTASYLLSASGNRDAAILHKLCEVRRALFNYISLSEHPEMVTLLDLPFSDAWMAPFVRTFSAIPVTQLRTPNAIKHVALALTAGKHDLTGGALTLRSGTRLGLPFRLRQRDNQQAVTETIRRNRGQSIQRFIDTLPARPRRTRRPPTQEPELPIETPAEAEEEPEIEEEASDLGEDTEDLSRITFNEEVLASIVSLLEALEEELSPRARRSNFFDFSSRFYALLLEASDRERLTHRFIRRWLINFFILEHISSTLFYLYAKLYANRSIRENIGVQFVQIILRGRDENGEDLYTRVWFSNRTNPFAHLYQRIRTDFLVTTQHADTETTFQAPEERDQLLQDMEFTENSGDVENIITQITSNDIYTDSVELAFRMKCSGLVGYSTHPIILQTFEEIRTAAIQEWRSRQR